MRWALRIFSVVMAGAFFLPSAFALCSYHGKMDAKTTVAQEFVDSKWVVRVKVVAAEDHWSDEDDSWTIYHLQVLTAFKGNPAARLQMFTHLDSGGFYLDNGGEYLLFLNPLSPRESAPAVARGATDVNYACGESKAWSLVRAAEQKRLIDLSIAHGH